MFWKRGKSFALRMEQATRTLNAHMGAQVTEDRENTIGASECNACPAKVVRSKLQPELFQYSTLAKFFRGHRQEEFNAPVHRRIAIEDGCYWIPQLRVLHPEEKRLRAHVDNVYFDAPTNRIQDAVSICVVEEKNAQDISNEPLDDYVAQLHYQMGLLKLNFPNAMVSGYLYQTDLNGEHTDYGGLIVPNYQKAEELFERGKNLLKWIDAKKIPEPEPSMKCGWCLYQRICSKWQGQNVPIDPATLAEFKAYYDLKEEIKKLEKRRDAKKRSLRNLLQGSGKHTRFSRDGVIAGVRMQKGKESCSIETLKRKYPDVANDPAVISRGRSFPVLTVNFKPEEKEAI